MPKRYPQTNPHQWRKFAHTSPGVPKTGRTSSMEWKLITYWFWSEVREATGRQHEGIHTRQAAKL